MATNVKSRISLQCRVCQINDMTDPNKRGPKEGKQWHNQWDCETDTIDINEWNWRYATAKAILCVGEVVTTGSYYGDVIGGEWEIGEGLGDNEDKFNER